MLFVKMWLSYHSQISYPVQQTGLNLPQQSRDYSQCEQICLVVLRDSILGGAGHGGTAREDDSRGVGGMGSQAGRSIAGGGVGRRKRARGKNARAGLADVHKVCSPGETRARAPSVSIGVKGRGGTG